MDLKELEGEIRENLELSIKADKEGRPDETRECLIIIQTQINEYLGDINAAETEPEKKEETAQTAGPCQPDQTHEESS